MKFDIIFSELSFGQSLLPWDNLYFYYGIQHLKQLNNSQFYKDKKIMPFRIRFKAIAVQLEDLDKIRSPVGETEGFDITEFDKVILVRFFLLFDLE
jgi:protein arginine N-methyltransferase 7